MSPSAIVHAKASVREREPRPALKHAEAFALRHTSLTIWAPVAERAAPAPLGAPRPPYLRRIILLDDTNSDLPLTGAAVMRTK